MREPLKSMQVAWWVAANHGLTIDEAADMILASLGWQDGAVVPELDEHAAAYFLSKKLRDAAVDLGGQMYFGRLFECGA